MPDKLDYFVQRLQYNSNHSSFYFFQEHRFFLCIFLSVYIILFLYRQILLKYMESRISRKDILF